MAWSPSGSGDLGLPQVQSVTILTRIITSDFTGGQASVQADLETTVVTEIGLRLPDNTLVFPPDSWHDRPLDTPIARLSILDALRASARNLGMPETELLGRFSWVRREREILCVSRVLADTFHDMDDPSLFVDAGPPD